MKARLRIFFTLVHKEFLLEWREKYALNGLLLYVVSSVLLVYFGFGLRSNRLQPLTWNILFWIIQLFVAVNAIAKSFMQERQGRLLYYYTLASPHIILFSKIAYNSFLMLLISGLGYGVYSVVLGNPVQDQPLYLFSILLGSLGFACSLTLISALVARVNHNTTLMAVLSFPLLISLLLMLIRISQNAVDGLDRFLVKDEITTILAIIAIVLGLSYLLFPYLWRA